MRKQIARPLEVFAEGRDEGRDGNPPASANSFAINFTAKLLHKPWRTLSPSGGTA
jgi:hypothetical protein